VDWLGDQANQAAVGDYLQKYISLPDCTNQLSRIIGNRAQFMRL
jgi:hypothetical protein